MAPAQYDQTQAEIVGGSPIARALPAPGDRGDLPPAEGGDYVFRANGSVLAFDGFYKVWGRDENGENELPPLAESEALEYHDIKPEQHFTQPPPRYTEATLIKELEQRGIGRPSTYAPTVETIKDHGYVEVRERRLHPTHIGEAVNSLMVDHFKTIADDDYTAKLEKRLDEVESGKQEWVPVVSDVYGPLQRMLSAAEEATPAETDGMPAVRRGSPGARELFWPVPRMLAPPRAGTGV
jgi:DNA topoisomerase IA